MVRSNERTQNTSPTLTSSDGELLVDFSDPKRCLKPVDQWPSATPIGHAMSSAEEWYKIVERSLRLGFVDTVNEADGYFFVTVEANCLQRSNGSI